MITGSYLLPSLQALLLLGWLLRLWPGEEGHKRECIVGSMNLKETVPWDFETFLGDFNL